MICDSCGGKGYLMPYMKHPGGPPCNKCHGTGWLIFWTPAERAGLKAMGRDLINTIAIDRKRAKEGKWTQHDDELAIQIETSRYIIHAYVQAARKEKEE